MKEYKTKLLMIGPNPNGKGGISKVLSIWINNKFNEAINFDLIFTTKDNTKIKFFYLLYNLFKFFIKIHNSECVYIHTASFNSFYRKSIFILVAKIYKKKIFLHIHPNYFFTFITKSAGLKKQYINTILRRVDTFIVLTNEMKKNIKTLFPQKKIYVLRNAVDFDEFKYHDKKERYENKILFLGWYVREKGIYELADAIDILNKKGSNISLELYGTKSSNKLKNYIIGKNIKNIHIGGWISGEKKVEVLKKCTAIALPSFTEGIPNVILEAMAAKAPIITTNRGGLKEILIDRENAIICEYGNSNDLSEKIELLINDKKLRLRIAENAFVTAKQKFSVKKIKKELSEIIKLEG